MASLGGVIYVNDDGIISFINCSYINNMAI
jgi:hypothetical protein